MIVLENEVSDRVFRRDAEIAFHKVKNFLTKNLQVMIQRDAEFHDPWNDKGVMRRIPNGGYSFQMGYLDKRYSDLVLYFYSQSEMHKLGLTGGIGKTKTKPIQTVILLSVLKSDWDLEYADSRFQKKTFVHEFTHYLDQKRYKGTIGTNSASAYKQGGDASYYNTPSEFNAFYTEAISTSIKMFTHEIVRERFLSSFDAFQSFMLKSAFEGNFVNNLNIEYKKKLTKRLYDLYLSLRKKWKM